MTSGADPSGTGSPRAYPAAARNRPGAATGASWTLRRHAHGAGVSATSAKSAVPRSGAATAAAPAHRWPAGPAPVPMLEAAGPAAVAAPCGVAAEGQGAPRVCFAVDSWVACPHHVAHDVPVRTGAGSGWWLDADPVAVTSWLLEEVIEPLAVGWGAHGDRVGLSGGAPASHSVSFSWES